MKKKKTPSQSKAKFEDFWYYHKTAVILGIVAFIFIGMTMLNSFVNVDPDLKITMVTREQQGEAGLFLKTAFEDRLTDINGDNYVEVSVRDMVLGDDLSADSAPEVQKSLESQLANRGATLFIFDKTNYERMIRKDAFAPLDQFYDMEAYADRVLYRGDMPVAFSLSGSKLLSEAGVTGDEFYGLLLFQRPEDAGDALRKAEYENAVKALTALLES